MWKAIVVIVSQWEHRAVFGLLHPCFQCISFFTLHPQL